MSAFEFCDTTLKDAKRIVPMFAADERGYFVKSYERQVFEWAGVTFDPFEGFETQSKRGVLRGLHFQEKHPQAKLVRVISGEVYDVIVDLRKNAPSFGQWEGFVLSEENRNMLFVPRGFAHGFYVMSECALVSYLCDRAFSTKTDSGVRWDDPKLNIDWPIPAGVEPTLSHRDRNLPCFEAFVRKNLFAEF